MIRPSMLPEGIRGTGQCIFGIGVGEWIEPGKRDTQPICFGTEKSARAVIEIPMENETVLRSTMVCLLALDIGNGNLLIIRAPALEF